MLQLHVALPSGRSESLSILPSSKVGDLKLQAQECFQQGFLRLATADGQVLNDPLLPLEELQLQDGDHLTGIASPAQLGSNPQLQIRPWTARQGNLCLPW